MMEIVFLIVVVSFALAGCVTIGLALRGRSLDGPPPRPPQLVAGVLLSIEPEHRRVAILVHEGPLQERQVFLLLPDAALTLNGMPEGLATLPEGSRVEFSYHQLG